MLTEEAWLLDAATTPKDPLTWSGFKLSWYVLPLKNQINQKMFETKCYGKLHDSHRC